MAMKAKGKIFYQLEFLNPEGINGFIYSDIMNILILILQFYIALFSLNGWKNTTKRTDIHPTQTIYRCTTGNWH